VSYGLGYISSRIPSFGPRAKASFSHSFAIITADQSCLLLMTCSGKQEDIFYHEYPTTFNGVIPLQFHTASAKSVLLIIGAQEYAYQQMRPVGISYLDIATKLFQ